MCDTCNRRQVATIGNNERDALAHFQGGWRAMREHVRHLLASGSHEVVSYEGGGATFRRVGRKDPIDARIGWHMREDGVPPHDVEEHLADRAEVVASAPSPSPVESGSQASLM